MTVGEYLDQWIAGKARLRSNTRRSYQGHIDLYLKPGLGHIRVTQLRDVHIERLYAALPLVGRAAPGDDVPDEVRRILAVRDRTDQVRPMGATSIRRVHATLMSALNTAVKRKLLPANPAAHVELPTRRRAKAVVWTAERIAVWQRTGSGRSSRCGPRSRPASSSTPRRSTGVDLSGRSLTITQEVVQLGWELEVGAPKTDTGARTVSLDEASAAALTAWRLAGRYQSGPKTDTRRPPGRVNALVSGGAPSGTRTPNPLIKRTEPSVPRREGLDQW
ncbi:MAG TPA: hypothetical protein VKB14_16240 [Actinomycetales bacterium]|nr:hypothetical protein [Actinomycetales bacterium]